MPDSIEKFANHSNLTKIPREVAFIIGSLDKFGEVEQRALNEYLEKIPHAETIVGCGKGWFVDPNTNPSKYKEFEDAVTRLSPEAKLTVIACGILLVSGKSERIIFTGGKTAGADNISEATAMKQFLLKVFGDSIPDSQKIVTEDYSADTLDNAIKVKEINQGTDAIVVTIGYHAPRTEMIFKKQWQKSDLQMVKSDELVRLGWPKQRYLHQIEGLHQIDKLLFEKVREAFAGLIYLNEHTSALMQGIAKKKRMG